MAVLQQISKFRISRRGRKLQISDDQRTLVALPKDLPERTWYTPYSDISDVLGPAGAAGLRSTLYCASFRLDGVSRSSAADDAPVWAHDPYSVRAYLISNSLYRAEILQKEENDLVILDIREEILEEALRIGYENYMKRQTSLFTAHIAAQAWLKLIDWHFYRHDPGEDPSASPPCFIPKRVESWIPDEIADPSPKDTWCRQELNVIEDTPDESVQKWPSSSSIDLPLVEEIPSEFWFPGKVNVHEDLQGADEKWERSLSYGQESSGSAPLSSDDQLAAESEVLQKVTDYSADDLSPKESTFSALKTTTPVDGSLHGAGDSTVVKPKRRLTEKSKVFSRPSMLGRSKATLPPLDIGESRSRLSVISDCRLRNLRLDTQYEISSEKVDTPPGETVKRK